MAHDSTNLAEGYGGPQDPAVPYTPSDVVADLRGVPGLGVEKNERVLAMCKAPRGSAPRSMRSYACTEPLTAQQP